MTQIENASLPLQQETLPAPGIEVTRDVPSEPLEQSNHVPATDPELGQQADTDTSEPSTARRWLVRGAYGALAVGGAVTLALSPWDKLEHDVESAAPWVGGGIVATEALWIGGAAIALGASGQKIGNPFTIKKRFGEVKESLKSSRVVETGVTVNTAGALGTAGFIMAGAVAALPVETWPGAVGIAALDMASTVALRAPIYQALHKDKAETNAEAIKPMIRRTRLEDIDRLADLDLELFAKAYGEKLPTKEAVIDMLTRRYHNTAGELMFTAELDGQIEGFVTALRTNKGEEGFESWEDSTANGTLDGKVEPKGKYVYVVNMTISPKGTAMGAKPMLLANLFADGVRGGAAYGFFESRMPGFRRWLTKSGKMTDDPETLHDHALEYFDVRRRDGQRLDKHLRMHERDGFELGRVVPNAFDDYESLDFGVVCKADSPLPKTLQKIAPARWAFAGALRQIAKHPKILNKVF